MLRQHSVELLTRPQLIKRWGRKCLYRIAAGRDVAQIAAAIGADWLIYQDLEDLVQACRHDNASITGFDTSCFSGEYVTGDVTPEYLARLQQERNDDARVARRDPQLKVVN